MQLISLNDSDIMLNNEGQPVFENGDFKVLEMCWLQDIVHEALTSQNELFYQNENDTDGYGWNLSEFVNREYDPFLEMEIQQCIQKKLSSREYIDAASIQTYVQYDGHTYNIHVTFKRNDETAEYNIDITENGVEVSIT